MEKHDRFVTLAEKRVNRALDQLRLIGNLSNRHNYSYTDEDAHRIVAALEGEVRQLKRRFSSEVEGDRPRFTLQSEDRR